MYTTKDLFDLDKTQAKAYLAAFPEPWDALAGLKAFIVALGATLGDDYEELLPQVWVHKTAEIAKTAYLTPPCIIGAGTQVRHCAYIRGSVLVGKDCVVGNSVELKNAILFDCVQVPHYNYVGDAILGYRAHMGAGSITSNVKSDKTPVVVRDGENRKATGLKKLGAMLGDYAEIGCNSVLNPGTIVGRNARVYPLSCVRGTVQANCVYKNANEVVEIR